MKNKGKKTGIIVMIIGCLFVFSALGLFLYNTYQENYAETQSSKAIKVFDEQVSINEEELPDYIVNPYMNMPTKVYDGREYVGTLYISALGLKLPVLNEWSYEGLKIAPCRYGGTPYLNNLIIAAHNYRSHFAYLRTLSEGDEVIFKDMDGNVFNYKVKYIEILDNNAVEDLSAGEWDLTLFTCTYGGESRVTVRCEEI